jgi:phage-related protein
MSDSTYTLFGDPGKPLVWLNAEIKTPPFTRTARLEAGYLLRRLQRGEHLSMPHARPMPAIGKRCHELRVRDFDRNWRIILRMDADAIVIAMVFVKTTVATPRSVIDVCRQRLLRYDAACE